MRIEEIQQLYFEEVAELERQRRDEFAAAELRFRRAMSELVELADKAVDYWSLPLPSQADDIGDIAIDRNNRRGTEDV